MFRFFLVVDYPNDLSVQDGVLVGLFFMIDIIYSKVKNKNESMKMNVKNLDTIKPGLIDLSSRILGPNSVTQAALPHILSETPDSYYEDILHQLEVKILNSNFFIRLNSCRIMPSIFINHFSKPLVFNQPCLKVNEDEFLLLDPFICRCNVYAYRYQYIHFPRYHR